MIVSPCAKLPKMHKYSLYETASKYYIVGADVTEKRYRILKVDRTADEQDLSVTDDKIVYTQKEMNQLLDTIDDGNKAALAACNAQPQSANAATESRAQTGLQQVPLTIHSDGRGHRFTVMVARTAAEQATGLMYRESLGPGEGMIFPYDPPQVVGFWMKNTLIPLDMLFLREDGTVARVARNARPFDLTPIPSGEPVRYVLELNGGKAADLGVAEGDRLEHPIIGTGASRAH